MRWPNWRWAAACALFFAPLPAEAIEIPKVAIVVDGPSDILNEMTLLLAQEVKNLTEDRVASFTFPTKPTHVGDFTQARCNQLLEEVLRDKQYDMVVALGFLAGNAVARRESLEKPVFIPYAEPELQGLPRSERVSGRRNLSYITGLLNFERDLRRFSEVMDASQVTFIFDKLVVDAIRPKLEAVLREAQVEGMRVDLLGVSGSAKSILDLIPKQSESVYIGTLLRLPRSEVQSLLDGLKQRKLPSYASQGRRWVEQGAFVSLAADDEDQRRFRRVALYMMDAAEGSPLSQFSVVFEPRAQLVINMGTAKAIGVFPSFQLMTEAVLLNNEPGRKAESLSLRGAVDRAVEQNRALEAIRLDADVAEANYRSAWSVFLPDFSFQGTGTWIDADLASSLFNAERELAFTLTASQLLFAPAPFQQINAQDAARASAQEGIQTQFLDTVQNAAGAYLQVLRTRTSEKINRDNLQRVRTNLALAEVRVEVGASGRQDIFRWQAELANSRATVISSSAQRNQAEIQLNQVINRPLEQNFSTEDPLGQTGIVLDPRVGKYIDDPFSFKLFRAFLAQEAQANSPELKQLSANIVSLERTLEGQVQELFIPELFLSGSFSQNIARDGTGSENLPGGLGIPGRQDNSWQAGITLNFVLFDYTRYAQIDSTRASLEQLERNRDTVSQAVEANIRTALHQAGASRASVVLRQDAAKASEANFELVSDEYFQGKVDIIRLLDAQNQALTANLNAANAVYDFLTDFIAVERASGTFYFLSSEQDKQAFLERLSAFAKGYEGNQ